MLYLERKGAQNMTFSEKLITLRAGRSWSQEQLAQTLDVTRQAVGRWERGECLPDAPGLTRLARVFDVDPEWLLDDTASGEPRPRSARRIQLAWFDWVMLGLAAASLVAMLCGLNMETADRIFQQSLRYPAWTWCALLTRCLVWLGGGWAAVALVYSFFACPLALKPGIKRLLLALGTALLALYLVCIFVTWGQALRWVDLDISVRTFLRLVDHPELCAIPGVLFSNCVKRKEKQPAAR